MTTSINERIEKISNKFKELKKCEFPIVQRLTIEELRKLCSEAIHMLGDVDQSAEKMRKRKSIDHVLNKCKEIEKEIEEKQNKQELNHGNHNIKNGMNYDITEEDQANKSKAVVRKLIEYEMRSSELKISPKELEEIARRMEDNLEMMKDIKEMVVQQGGNLELIQNHISMAYENIEMANVELTEAKEIQHRNRILKMRLGISGFFGALGMKIFGIPGLVLGLFTGWRTTN